MPNPSPRIEEKPNAPRYAVYLTAHPDELLTEKAGQWLGRCPWQRKSLPQPKLPGVDPDLMNRATSDPRMYGFHATLRAPFELDDAADPEELMAAISDFAANSRQFDLQLSVQFLSVFLALRTEDQTPVTRLCNQVLQVCEPYRAPLSDYDRARRMKMPLSLSQTQNLNTWGYPFVDDDFHFHMTLTGALSEEQRTPMRAAAETWFAEVLSKPTRFKGLSVFQQPDRNTPFSGIHYAPFDSF